jgi:hypothetical protein
MSSPSEVLSISRGDGSEYFEAVVRVVMHVGSTGRIVSPGS